MPPSHFLKVGMVIYALTLDVLFGYFWCGDLGGSHHMDPQIGAFLEGWKYHLVVKQWLELKQGHPIFGLRFFGNCHLPCNLFKQHPTLQDHLRENHEAF